MDLDEEDEEMSDIENKILDIAYAAVHDSTVRNELEAIVMGEIDKYIM